jgi:glyoxylase-like metal-dependent hydrolase (beta-lactamase superfamily II)
MPDKIQSTKEISDGLYILNLGFVSSYLVRTGDSLIAFDAGMKPNKVVSEMKKLDLDPVKVQAVFYTHSDRDHVGGASAFPHAKAFISEDEMPMLNHTTARFFRRVYNKPLTFPYETLKDGQELKFSSTLIKCISTPGHTSGSMSFLINGMILIVGDELNLNKGKAVIDRGILGIDNAVRLESIHKLAKLLGVRIICAAHSGYSEDFDIAMKDWQEG